MAVFQFRNANEQVAEFLKSEIVAGRYGASMPGGDRLSKELGVGKATIESALARLEKEGFLKSRGKGRPREVVRSEKAAKRGLQLRMILYEPDDVLDPYALQISRKIESSEHHLGLAAKSLRALKHDPARVAKMVEAEKADAWIVIGGSRPVLEWFAGSRIPAFALFGRVSDLPIAATGPDKLPALREVVHRLAASGRDRIVMFAREERRKPNPGISEQVFLDALQAEGIRPGAYNLPDWEENAEGLARCLDELFAYTPPSAILVGDSNLFVALKDYLGRMRGLAVRQVTLILTEPHPSFEWMKSPPPHFQWDRDQIVRNVWRWVRSVAAGKEDRKQRLVPAKFIQGNAFG